MAPTKSTKPAAKLPARAQKTGAKAPVKASAKAAAAPARTAARPRPKQAVATHDEGARRAAERLLAERVELQEQLATLEEDTFAASQSDLSGEVAFDDETADAGTATFERERDLSIENNVRDLLAKIDRAIRRMDEGTYGLCDRCGKPIEKARIKALPYVDLCIKDAQAQSRR